ncbi:MAG: glycoside hydrolase family 9 protein [Fibrobacter sp.]|jgi:endoglucanase|nr:glycoside hydrolase family 9 protein [Fibrobacter sp.]
MDIRRNFLFFGLVLAVFSFAEPLPRLFSARINQVGYELPGLKLLVWPGTDSGKVELKNVKNGKTAFSVPLSSLAEWEFSGESVRVADFSKFEEPGTYIAYLNDRRISGNIFIRKGVYEDVFRSSLKWFYYQRASTPLEGEFAGRFARLAGHPDTNVLFYPPEENPAFRISSPKGWYDAGDYGKYIVNSGITVFTLLQLYEHFPAAAAKFKTNIPESKNATPDLLDEVRWNLDWMLTMQAEDGGVYHKLTTQQFSGPVLPEFDTAERFVVMKSTAAALNFAAVMAQAARVYRSYDNAFSKKSLAAAERAYAWAEKNPLIAYKQPDGMNTGQYNADQKFTDEELWASAELLAATKNKKYRDAVERLTFTSEGAWWGNSNFLAVYRLASMPSVFGKEKSAAAKDSLLVQANMLREQMETSAYRLPVFKWNFVWGSNSAVANNGIVLLNAYYLTQDVRYLNAAQRALDYLLGSNPMEISFVTGAGARSPRNPHHRPSEGDDIDDPVPGALVGGPHAGKQDVGTEHWKCKDYAASGFPAVSYVDDRCSYATNEVAINWNAPLVYLSGALHFLYTGERKPLLK